MKTIRTYVYPATLFLLMLLSFGLAQHTSAQQQAPVAATDTPQYTASATASSLPQPPVMTNDKFLALIGQGQAQVILLNEYTRSLESTIARLDTKIAQLEALKTTTSTTPAPCTTQTDHSTTTEKKKGKE